MGRLRRSQNRLDEARLEFEKAVSLNRSRADSFSQLGQTLMFLGEPEAGILFIEKAIRLDPHAQQTADYAWALGACHLLLGRLDQATYLLRSARAANPRYWYLHAWLAAALGLRGDLGEARAALTQAMKLKPEINSLARWCTGRPWLTDPRYLALAKPTLYAGLRQAGMPDE